MDEFDRYLQMARALAAEAGASAGDVPTRDRPDEGWFVVQTGPRLELWYTERGLDRLEVGGDADDLTYEVLFRLTVRLAQDHELRHRRRGEDSRRQWMADHVARMARLRASWGEATRRHYDRVLEEHPFDDRLAQRAERWRELMDGGMDRAAAVAQAEREIP